MWINEWQLDHIDIRVQMKKSQEPYIITPPPRQLLNHNNSAADSKDQKEGKIVTRKGNWNLE